MIIRLLVASPAPKGVQTVAPATHVRGLRFFHPTTSFALLDAQMAHQEETQFGAMFVMANAPVRTRSVSPTCKEEAVRVGLPVNLRNHPSVMATARSMDIVPLIRQDTAANASLIFHLMMMTLCFQLMSVKIPNQDWMKALTNLFVMATVPVCVFLWAKSAACVGMMSKIPVSL
jgi:hypothetical protein